MKKKQFDMDVNNGNKRIRVIAENYTSAAELVSYCKGRKCTHAGYKHHDYFNDDSLYGGSWEDFENSEELMELIKNGEQDLEKLRDVAKYAMTAQVLDKEKLITKHMDVVGGGVDVPAFLTGEPNCMYGLKRKKVKSRIIKLCIYCKALSYISAGQYKRAGELIAKTVAKLEKAGYRIRLLAMDAYEDRNYARRAQKMFDGRHDIWVVTHMIKRENEPMNYRRVMFPLTRMAYHRGLGFAWMSVNGSPEISGLGGDIDDVVHDTAEREEMFARACGENDYIILSQVEVIGLMERYGTEQAQKMVDAKVMAL